MAPNENDNNDSEFDQYFQDLLGIPWHEYLQMDDELEIETASHAPDANN